MYVKILIFSIRQEIGQKIENLSKVICPFGIFNISCFKEQ